MLPTFTRVAAPMVVAGALLAPVVDAAPALAGETSAASAARTVAVPAVSPLAVVEAVAARHAAPSTAAHRSHLHHLHHLHVIHEHVLHLLALAHKAAKNARARILAAARTFLGVPYRNGGTSHAGVDCSGLVVASYEQALRKRLPRTVAGLRIHGRATRSPQPGDVLIYNGEDHTALVYTVSHGRVTRTLVARHSGTVVQFQAPYAGYQVRSYLAA